MTLDTWPVLRLILVVSSTTTWYSNMRFCGLSTLVTTSTILFTLLAGSSASPSFPEFKPLVARDDALSLNLGNTLSPSNFYGAPIPPWNAGSHPGWYHGDHHDWLEDLGWLCPWLEDKFICWILDFFPEGLHCPKKPPSDGWVQVFSNLTAAISASDYLTFGLVDTVDHCKSMCDGVKNCNFFNTYHDVNGKNGSPLLTCALFSLCHTSADATNAGGQSQPDGSVDYIINSDGFCFAPNSTSSQTGDSNSQSGNSTSSP